jgi:rubrerythrin
MEFSDIYLRAAAKSEIGEAKSVLLQIASDERSHIARLSRFIDNQTGVK